MQFDFAFPVPTRAVRTTAHHSKLLAFAVALLTMTPISHAQDTPRPARPTPPTTARPENAQSADDQIFSGPQIGELLPELPIRLALGAQAGSDFDPVTTAAAKPVLLIFVHDINRQSISMTRVLSGYCTPEQTRDYKRPSFSLPMISRPQTLRSMHAACAHTRHPHRDFTRRS